MAKLLNISSTVSYFWLPWASTHQKFSEYFKIRMLKIQIFNSQVERRFLILPPWHFAATKMFKRSWKTPFRDKIFHVHLCLEQQELSRQRKLRQVQTCWVFDLTANCHANDFLSNILRPRVGVRGDWMAAGSYIHSSLITNCKLE